MTKKIIFTAGTWDLFHVGHLNILKKAKELGDYLIVGVSTDKLVKSHKGCKPILTYKQRAAVIKDIIYVDKVVKQTKLIDLTQFKKLKANIFVIGDDWKTEKNNSGLNWLRKHKKVKFIPYTKELSTTEIKNKIIKNAYDILKVQKIKGKL